EAIREHEQLRAEAQQLARLGTWQWDIEHNTVSWSEELYGLFGTEPGALDASFEGYLEQIHPDDRQMAREHVERALADGQPFVFEHRVTQPDGSERWLQARGRVITDDAGQAIRMQGTAQEVTEARQALEDRRRLDELRLRQRHALEVNDDIIQGLAVADLALNLDDVDKAKESIAETLLAARRFVTDLLGDGGEVIHISPGDLRRRSYGTGS